PTEEQTRGSTSGSDDQRVPVLLFLHRPQGCTLRILYLRVANLLAGVITPGPTPGAGDRSRLHRRPGTSGRLLAAGLVFHRAVPQSVHDLSPFSLPHLPRPFL